MNKQVLMRRYLRNQTQLYSGQPGIDHFNLNSTLEQIANTANNVSGSVQSVAKTVDNLKTQIGANISGIRSAVKTMVQPVASTPSATPNVSYLGNVSAPFADMSSNKTLMSVLIFAVVLGVVFFIVKR